ncbi:hypothetical protein GCM10023346_31450 [Arthrobacter gyeryongensis]|uniref:Uncharacterized protein n=1 Tax=Arthrobacter gyeryongensis TaxID=1650592 RepID=A0ABP9SIZ9_9MICC
MAQTGNCIVDELTIDCFRDLSEAQHWLEFYDWKPELPRLGDHIHWDLGEGPPHLKE